MRIISQSGRFDIPYENAVVYVEYESVIAKVGDERYAMGKYSTEEKAVKTMEMSVSEFADYGESGIFRFPQDDEIEV